MNRTLRHLCTSRWRLARDFPAATLVAIEQAIREGEKLHGGEVRFAIETCLDLSRLRAGTTARQRAVEMFGALGVWDTAANNGVLIYLLLADRDIEIVADRGLDGLVSAAEWQSACSGMEEAFRNGRFLDGAVAGIRRASELVGRHFPPAERDQNELPDRPVVVG